MIPNKPFIVDLSTIVRLARLELARREALDPKSSVATNYTTAASLYFLYR